MTDNEEYEDCEEIGDLGRYLCDMCYTNTKTEIEVDES